MVKIECYSLVPISPGLGDGGSGVCLSAAVAAQDPAALDCLMSYCNVSSAI